MSAVVDFPVQHETSRTAAGFAPPSGEPPWLTDARHAGLAQFAKLGMPSRRSEAWRYIDLGGLDRFQPAASRPAAAGAAAVGPLLDRMAVGEIGHRLVLVDGRFAPELSQIGAVEGVWFGPTAQAIRARPDLLRRGLRADTAFAALNAAFFADGYVLEVGAGVRLESPIAVVHLASGEGDAAIHARHLVVLGAGSDVSLFEIYAGAGRYWRNDALDIRLGAGAQLDRICLVEEAADAVHLDDADAALAEGARLANFALLLGGRTSRNEIRLRMEGEGAGCRLDGAFVISGRQQANIVTSVDHCAPKGETRELVKGVAAGRAHGAFQGRIAVAPGAQKVDAQQTSRNLLLGDRAVIDAKPELEIDADDVKCAHGATVGDLDEAALFYLRSRGIPAEEARRLLIDAFVREAVERVEHAALRAHLLERLAVRLAGLEE